MTTLRCENDDDANAMSNPKYILREGCQIPASLSAAKAVGIPPIASQSLQVVLQELSTPPPTTKGEETFDAIAGRPLSEERQPSRTPPHALRIIE